MSRTGVQALSLLGAPLNVELLGALEDGPQELNDLRRAVGSPPQSTMRVYSGTLVELGLVERERKKEYPTASVYASTGAGKALLGVGEAVQAWLDLSPGGPIQLGSPQAKHALKALVEGWSINAVRALAAKPLSLTELHRFLPQVTYPSLERRLSTMRSTDLIESFVRDGRSRPYRVTTWGRQAVAALVAAAAWEQRWLVDQPRIGRFDVEATFLLALPLVTPPPSLSGQCRLAVEVKKGSKPGFAGVRVSFADGKLVSCTSRLQGDADGWASGGTIAWIRTLSQSKNHLEVGGDANLVRKVIDGLRTIPAGQ